MAKAAPKAAAKKKVSKLTKAGLITEVQELVGESVSRKEVKTILETLTSVGAKELKKNGVFVLPGFAKFEVKKRDARPAREGVNPFTGQPTTFAAKPASKVVRARAVKALKDAISG
jgi:DNA-binding protein HU-beta